MKTKGGHFIKIMISGLMDFNRYGVLTDEPMPDALIRELANIAHGEGFSIMARRKRRWRQCAARCWPELIR